MVVSAAFAVPLRWLCGCFCGLCGASAVVSAVVSAVSAVVSAASAVVSAARTGKLLVRQLII